MVLFGQFHGRFNRLRTVTDEQKVIYFVRGQSSQYFGQLHGPGVRKVHGGKIGQLHSLLHDGLGQVLSSIANMNRSGNPGHKV